MLGERSLRAGRHRSGVAAALALALAAAPASADALRPVQVELTGGARWGDGSSIVDASLYAGGAFELARTGERTQLFAGGGLRAGFGEVSVDDVRGLGGEVSRDRVAFGPELRAGWAGGEGWTDVYLYAAVAALAVNPGREGPREDGDERWALGGRAALGLAIPGSYAMWIDDANEGPCDGGGCSLLILMVLLPNTFEITAEHSRVADGPRWRYGLALGYAF